ncbi:hypothetical protein, partial [Streptomyces europaeiscabiei]|uniref:hypothetical protein n=1 Tax=Streptomyces europaeiscabiei TaxID=146819 RepID=UPI0038F674DF
AFGTATAFPAVSASGGVTAYELVNTAAKLQAINAHLSENYALAKNIDASSITNFIPLGTDGLGGMTTPFSGNFDGQGF